MKNTLEENICIENYDKKILMRIQFVLEIYVYRRRLYKKTQKLYGSFLHIQVLCHYWPLDYRFKLHGVMKKAFILLSHFVVVKDFKSSSKWTINVGVPQNFLSDILCFK